MKRLRKKSRQQAALWQFLPCSTCSSRCAEARRTRRNLEIKIAGSTRQSQPEKHTTRRSRFKSNSRLNFGNSAFSSSRRKSFRLSVAAKLEYNLRTRICIGIMETFASRIRTMHTNEVTPLKCFKFTSRSAAPVTVACRSYRAMLSLPSRSSSAPFWLSQIGECRS